MSNTEGCCHPVQPPHTKQISGGCKKLSEITADKLRELTGKEFVVCSTCVTGVKCLYVKQKMRIQINSSVKSNSDNDTETIQRTLGTEAVDTSAAAVDDSPLKFRKVIQRDSSGHAKRIASGYVERKAAQLYTPITQQVTAVDVLGLNHTECSLQDCQKCEDYNVLSEELKTRLEESPTWAERVQILALRPESWSIRTGCDDGIPGIESKKERLLSYTLAAAVTFEVDPS